MSTQIAPMGDLMQPRSLEFLIRQLANGTLPMKSIPRIWGCPGNGETCEACNGGLSQNEWVIEGISLAGGRHVMCFHHWQQERPAMLPAQSSDPAPALSGAPTPRSPGR
jgi:hypothetical protein